MTAADKRQNNRTESLLLRIEELSEPVCVSENFELIHVECLPAGGELIIRVYLDKKGGISIDDCAYMSRQLGDLMDVYLDDIGPYRLEVSSPGPKRPLKKREDFERFLDERVKIEVQNPVQNRRRMTGTLKDAGRDTVTVEVDKTDITVRFEEIKKARLAGQ
jgi:ribosome maturation factor RimP